MRIENTAPNYEVAERPVAAEESAQQAQPADIKDAAAAVKERLGHWGSLPDQSAANAIEQLKSDEFNESFTWQPAPFEPYPGYIGPPPFITEWERVPTFNQLTGQELVGYLLEGVMDKGNELNELKQFQALRNEPFVYPDVAANRVLAVVDRWIGILEANGQTEMTPEQKAQFAAELDAAAKPSWERFLADPVRPITIQPADPWIFA